MDKGYFSPKLRGVLGVMHQESHDLSVDKSNDHEYWMRQAILEARKAEELGEVPIGSIVVYENKKNPVSWRPGSLLLTLFLSASEKTG